MDPDVGSRQHEEDEITVAGSGGDMSGGVVGGGGGVASRGGGGQPLKHSGVYISRYISNLFFIFNFFK